MTRAPALLALLLAGCVHERTKATPTYDSLAGGPVAPRGQRLRPEGPRPERSRPVRAHDPLAIESPVAASLVPTSEPARAATVSSRASPAARSATAPARPAGPSSPKTTFLDADTEIAAGKATVHLPAELAGEAVFEGGAVEEQGPGRRVATGGARLRVRRMLVRAERVTLVVRPAGEEDVQVSARGGVSFRSSQARSVVEETDLKSLMLTNDAYVPLR